VAGMWSKPCCTSSAVHSADVFEHHVDAPRGQLQALSTFLRNHRERDESRRYRGASARFRCSEQVEEALLSSQLTQTYPSLPDRLGESDTPLGGRALQRTAARDFG
jgi:hypothetical protein